MDRYEKLRVQAEALTERFEKHRWLSDELTERARAATRRAEDLARKIEGAPPGPLPAHLRVEGFINEIETRTIQTLERSQAKELKVLKKRMHHLLKNRPTMRDTAGQ